MITIDNNRPCFVWGVGILAVRFLYTYKDKIYFRGFIDNFYNDSYIYGYNVYHLEELTVENNDFIVVATSYNNYLEIKKQLEAKGLKEFFNFVLSEWIDKMLVMLHGNCHMHSIYGYLKELKEFNEKYTFYPNPPIFNNDKGYIDKNVLEKLDVFIHQDIRNDNPYGEKLSDDYIRLFLKKDCLEITVPNLFSFGKIFYPQFAPNPRNTSLFRDKNGMFPSADIVIDGCIKNNYTINQIVTLIEEGNPFTEEEIIENFNLFLNKIKERQRNWDINIYDYIVNNYRDKQLFYDQGHPTSAVMNEISAQICKKLEIKDSITEFSYEMDTHEEFVYPCVTKALSLKWNQNYIRKSSNAKKWLTI